MKLNTKPVKIHTAEGGVATRTGAENELRRSVLTCMLWENTFYETGTEIASRIGDLASQVEPEVVAKLAIEARDKMQLRHVPLFLVRVLASRRGNGKLVAETLEHVVQRADEIAEFMKMYWTPKKTPISAGVKKGLARAFEKFNEYQLAKYDRAQEVRLRDVMFMVHPKPVTDEQARMWKRLAAGELEIPDTWETELSSGKDKKQTFERLIVEGKLGGLALLRNLRGMLAAGVDEGLIKERLQKGCGRALPFRFITAARYAPRLESEIEAAMLMGVEGVEELKGRTGLLVDVSGSMDWGITGKSETTRIDAACGLGILLREIAEDIEVATFSNEVVIVPSRRGFALRDAITGSQGHGGTELKKALTTLQRQWDDVDRVIVITDEQSQDGIAEPWTEKAYVINVAPYKNGVSYRNGWTHIDGWSETVVEFIKEHEKLGKD